jgi:hypothetical protein
MFTQLYDGVGRGSAQRISLFRHEGGLCRRTPHGGRGKHIVICVDEETSINALAAFAAAFAVNILVAIYGPWSTDRRGVPLCA